MTFPERLVEGYTAFLGSRLREEQSRYQELSEIGQSPEIMVIGCCDSRVSPEVIFDAKPGELFVVRNVANLVISTDINLRAVLEFAVVELQVKNIVVCGHYSCGGIKAALDGHSHGMLDGWLRNIKEVYQAHAAELDPLEGTAKEERLTQLVVKEQVLNLAKTVASVDALSNGRFVLGVGYGWNVEEMAHHGVGFRTRRAQVREHVLAMRELWTAEKGEYHGEFVDFSPSWTWPKPVQPGGPPVYIGGGAGPKMFAAVAEYADGWLPIGGAGVRAALGELRAACEDRGRDPGELDVIPFGTLPDAGKLGYYAELGITEVVLRLPSAPRDEVLPVLDDFAHFIDQGNQQGDANDT